MEQQFRANLVPVLDKGTNAYRLECESDLRKEVMGYIENDCMRDFLIQNDSDLKAAKAKLAEINKTKSLLASVRKTSSHILTDAFAIPMLELEKALDQAYSDLRKKRDEYLGVLEEKEPEKEKTYSIVVSDSDEGVIRKIAKYAKERRCSVKEI